MGKPVYRRAAVPAPNVHRRKGFNMKRFIALVMAASFAVLATGCNTMQGLGRDVEKGGEKVQKEAVEHKKY
jgi:predicted small secreted protein